MSANIFGETTVAVNVREVELAAVFQGLVDAVEDSLLVGGEIDDAVGDGDVDGIWLNDVVLGAEDIFDVAFSKNKLSCIRASLLELGDGFLGDDDLLFGHIDTDDLTVLAGELRSDEAILARAAAEVEEGEAFEV